MSISAELPNDKMPYLGEDEVASAKSATIATSNSNTSDAEEVEVKNNEMQSADEDVADDGEATDSSISSNTSNGAPSRKRRHFDADKVIATALNYLSTTEPARDELWQFMSYLHNVLKKLPAHLQMELKQKIQKAMCEVESHDASSKPANGAPAEKEVVPEN